MQRGIRKNTVIRKKKKKKKKKKKSKNPLPSETRNRTGFSSKREIALDLQAARGLG